VLTASSVTTRSTECKDVIGSVHFLTIFDVESSRSLPGFEKIRG
jgi:hypothetical protein